MYQAVKVNSLGKWKTVFQFLSSAMLLTCRHPSFLLRMTGLEDQGVRLSPLVG